MADKNMEAQISVEFEEATSRQSLNSGETINTLWGKVKRWLSDLKVVCFSGSYNDLSDTPTTATKDTDGLMSAEDKSKLDGVATGANKTIVDTILSNTSTNPVQNKVVMSALAEKALKSKYGDTTIDVGRKLNTTVGTYSTAEGYQTTASSAASHAEGCETTASKIGSHAEGRETTASGQYSHSEGYNTTASGLNSHAEGETTTASGDYSHAEGYYTTAIGDSSHAEGRETTASKNNSHAEGTGTTASGYASHAEGQRTTASGDYSHAGGHHTQALKEAEFAHGKFNQSNEDTIYSIGDGTADDARHNAFEITTDGGKLHDKDIATTDLIPTSLPANGGNADTVGGKSPSDFVEALTIQQTSYTRILIPDNVDVKSWLIENAKIGTIYYVTPECQGQINLPPMTAYGWAWFLFDGIRYVSKVMVSNVSARYYLLDHVNIPGDWKEISTTPIKSTTFSGTTGNSGNMVIWATSERKIPLFAEIVDCYCFPFLSSSDAGCYMIHAFDASGDKKHTAVSGTVYYIEI